MPRADILLPDAPSPVHAQLTGHLRSRILDGTWAPHGQMPSESELGAMFGVSRIMGWLALGDLQKAGLIFRIHGKGTFVSRLTAFQNVASLEGFGEAMSRMGCEILNRVTTCASRRPTRGSPPGSACARATKWRKSAACVC